MQHCRHAAAFTGIIWQLYMSLHVQILQYYDHPLQYCRNGSIQSEELFDSVFSVYLSNKVSYCEQFDGEMFLVWCILVDSYND